jgi:ABC-type transport system involved in cytochrome bd biosynthesis fused ATPase/permease subunit
VTSQVGPDPSRAAKEAAKKALDGTILQVVLVVLVGAAATSLRAYLFQAASEKVIARLRRQLFASLVNQVSELVSGETTGL